MFAMVFSSNAHSMKYLMHIPNLFGAYLFQQVLRLAQFHPVEALKQTNTVMSLHVQSNLTSRIGAPDGRDVEQNKEVWKEGRGEVEVAAQEANMHNFLGRKAAAI
jgi:hypothetical protein